MATVPPGGTGAQAAASVFILKHYRARLRCLLSELFSPTAKISNSKLHCKQWKGRPLGTAGNSGTAARALTFHSGGVGAAARPPPLPRARSPGAREARAARAVRGASAPSQRGRGGRDSLASGRRAAGAPWRRAAERRAVGETGRPAPAGARGPSRGGGRGTAGGAPLCPRPGLRRPRAPLPRPFGADLRQPGRERGGERELANTGAEARPASSLGAAPPPPPCPRPSPGSCSGGAGPGRSRSGPR